MLSSRSSGGRDNRVVEISVRLKPDCQVRGSPSLLRARCSFSMSIGSTRSIGVALASPSRSLRARYSSISAV